ncbi:hypothetical protein DPMN_053087 [Dreissena polymorpha]|uniref:Uncharacterized protein n=1 Tax=Dreissena polymorpha TaxID=45954 RepID=A0A9D4CN25_DREPO|nr:hypothetical protein DPMN_053087 [Dreissena polymorpha]
MPSHLCRRKVIHMLTISRLTCFLNPVYCILQEIGYLDDIRFDINTEDKENEKDV